MIRTTSLHSLHIAEKARMAPFAGWDMPINYPLGVAGEVRACRSNVGLFDVSHMGEVLVAGPDAEQFLQLITTNDVARLAPGSAQYSMLLNDSAGVIDDIIVYRKSERAFFVVVNASRREIDFSWMQDHSSSHNVSLEDISDSLALIAVQGPHAAEIVASVADTSGAPHRFTFAESTLAGVAVTLSRTGYTGEDGFEIFCAWDDAPALWRLLQDAGAAPCGLAARDVLRLEAAYPLYGHELDDTHTPYESGNAWATKPSKGSFIGSNALQEQRRAGPPTKLVGVRSVDPANAIPRGGHSVLSGIGGERIGAVTSGSLSPTIARGIALARVDSNHAAHGPAAFDIRGRQVGAEIVALPFYRNGV